MERRDFLKTSALATAALAIAPMQAGAEKKELATVKRYREIGATGLKMSDISCGCGKLPSPSMVLRAVDRGINYFDTAPDYGQSEEFIGEAMGKIQRDQIILASKFCSPEPYPSHLPNQSRKKDYIAAVEASLKRLKTDYLDFVFVHAIGEKSKDVAEEKQRLLSPEMLAAFAELKKAGKARYLAVSSHGPENMEELLLAAVQSGHFHLIQPSFNFMKFSRLPEVMKKAKQRGVGVIAMKTLAGAKEMNFDSKGAEFAPAAFKWVLSHEEVSGLIITMKSVANLDEYLPASGEKFTRTDQEVLNRYAELYGTAYCRTGCGQCQASCPRGVAIASTLRFQMYFNDYGMEKQAMAHYARLEANAAGCAGCDSKACGPACPYGLQVATLMREAHETLSFAV
jgi:predicted aldo/keto reductase-like oxidoreductase